MDEYIAISTRIALEKPVFIVGAARSGTSILYRSLLGHSSFRPKKSPGLIGPTETHCFRSPRQLVLPVDCASNPAFKYMLRVKSAYRAFVSGLLSARLIPVYSQRAFGQLIGSPLYLWDRLFTHMASDRSRVLHWRNRKYDHLVRLFFHFAQEARGWPRILEKTPSHIAYLPEIFWTFPNAVCVFIYRHPIDVFTSYRRRLEAEKRRGTLRRKQLWLRKSLSGFCARYRRDMENALRAQQDRSSRFLMVKYEEFVVDPGETIRSICEFISEPYEPTCINDMGQSHRDVPDQHLFGTIETRTKEWSAYISAPEACEIESILSDLISRFEYTPYSVSAKGRQGRI